MKVLCILGALLLVTVIGLEQIENDKEWNDYKTKFHKHYLSKEEDERRRLRFHQVKNKIQDHNMKYRRGDSEYYLSINNFTDWTTWELSKLNGFKMVDVDVACHARYYNPPNTNIPPAVNWLRQGFVSPVQYQGFCSSGYAYSAVGALESMMAIHTNKSVTKLSAQNLIDCTEVYGNLGCDGGWQASCFDYSKDKGIQTEESYPYTGIQGKCNYNSAKVVAKSNGCINIPKGDEDIMKYAVALKGPVSVGFSVAEDFYFYGGGIYHNHACNMNNADHAMLVVGYGIDDVTGSEFWDVKNSWGVGWGDKGYARTKRNEDNLCHIATFASFPRFLMPDA